MRLQTGRSTGAGRTMAALAVAAALLVPHKVAAQTVPSATPGAAGVAPAKDSLGRDTPRGTLFGFMDAARAGRMAAAALYLDTDEQNDARTALARQLYVVLDNRLPARLNEVSDRPEGSLTNPLKSDQDVIGTVAADDGPLDIVVERVDGGGGGRVWLFSRHTLDAIPAVYDDVHRVSVDGYLPRVLRRPRVGGLRPFAWLAFFVIVPLLYYVSGFVVRPFGPLRTIWRRRRGLPPETAMPVAGPLRVMLVALVIRWLSSSVDVPLMERQFWSLTARLLASAAIVWFGLRWTAHFESYMHRRLSGVAGIGDTAAMLRLGRRIGDALVVLFGVLLVLKYFGIDPTAALAGLGIGGIAVALAAQKTLENVIGGLSIIFDKAVRVGDFLKLGNTSGSVDYIGLRSTRIRTLDRTIVTVPNGQIASANIETLSARDMYWFHHYVGLAYETSAAQMRGILADIRTLLQSQPRVDASSVRARFIRLGAFSIDIEVFAYLFARDWPHFLEMQEQLLLDIIDIVERRGATIALPSQTVHVAGGAQLLPGPGAAAQLP